MGHLSRGSSHVLGLADSILTDIQHGSAPHNSYKLTLYLDPATCSDAGAVWVFCLLGITTTAFLAMLLLPVRSQREGTSVWSFLL